MKILIVIDQFDNSNNGTTISARRFAKGLQDAGHEVYVVSTGDKKDEYKFNLKELPLPPGISHIVKSQGMSFAIPNTEILEKAISSVDIVHFYMPFFISKAGLKICEKLNIPHTVAFHVQPENITYSIGLGTTITLVIQKPIYPNKLLTKKEAIIDLKEKVYNSMCNELK